jgi:hypothetical protein
MKKIDVVKFPTALAFPDQKFNSSMETSTLNLDIILLLVNL